ncbi:MAG: polyprenol phosphomannose-dependent alpha 1,6 mannosyltransferase MptB [Pseudonocardia sp.]|nr:polyprenol phosphomannose-dependent alpha 1,6 mannosyltransferase MptB [Pseudonocardia sp.]
MTSTVVAQPDADPIILSRPSLGPRTGGGRRTKPLLLGLWGSVVIAFAGMGAGGKLVRDPILEGTPLVAARFGHGYDLAVLGVYLGLGLLVWAWVLLGREVLARRAGGRVVLRTAVVWILPVVAAPPLFSRDVFSYLAYGEMPLRGFDPYSGGPSALTGPIADNVHWFWQDTPAAYGPLFILLAKGVVSIAGENMVVGVILMRLVMMAGLVPFVAALPGLVRHLGGRASVAVWLAVANPVMILHLVGGPHNDLLVVGLLSSGCLLVLDRKHAAGIALVTLAMAVKATAGFALPFLVLVWAARLEGPHRVRVVRASAAGIGVFLVVFTAVSVAAGVGLGWLSALNAPSNIVNWLSLPTGVGQVLHTVAGLLIPGLPEMPFVMVTRVIGGLVFLVIAFKQWRAASAGGADAVRRAGVVLMLLALLSPATLPWYYSWGMALLAAVPWTAAAMSRVIFMSVFLVVAAFPSGEVALYAFGYLALMLIGAVIAAKSLRSPDPLGQWSEQRDLTSGRRESSHQPAG